MAPLSLDDAVAVPDVVLSRELEGETVLLNLETGIYFGLDSVATTMFNELRDRSVVRSALTALERTYEVVPSALESDLLAFCESLIAKGLLRRTRSSL